MIYKDSEENLLREGVIKKCPVDYKAIANLEEEEDQEAERLWIEEAERRYQEYKQGKVQAIPANKVFQDARSKLK